MHRLIKPLFWIFLFLIILLIIDQVLVQVPPVHPAHAAVSEFYRDFRSRVIALVFGDNQAEPESIEAVIEKMQTSAPTGASKSQKINQSKGTSTKQRDDKIPQRYIYSDSKGELQFADSLEEVPAKFRKQAQPMAE